MAAINIRQLEDRARDVDPDLRYMALEDFQKYLNSPQSQPARSVSFFVPILFKLLGDPATEVQNQAVKSFAPLVRHSTGAETVRIVTKLYAEVEKTSNDSKFSTSVPTLALRSIFSESSVHFHARLSRTVFDELLPLMLQPGSGMTIDRVEILIDMIGALGAVLTLAELLPIVKFLIASAFKEKGIIGKRSIIAANACLSHVNSAAHDQQHHVHFYDQVVVEIVSIYHQSQISAHSSDVFYTLFQVVVSQAHVSKCISDVSIDAIFNEIMHGLSLDQVGESINSEDLDIDDLVQTNLVRENALITLAGIVPFLCFEKFPHFYPAQVFQVLSTFTIYDPLFYQDSEDEGSMGDDSEYDFSDDEEIEQFENTGENDALAAKLRLSAFLVLKKLLQHDPQVLPLLLTESLSEKMIAAIPDRSEIVSNEAIAALAVFLGVASNSRQAGRLRSNSDVSMATENADIRPYAVIARECIVPIEQAIFGTLLTAKNISRFSHSKVLVDSLISGFTSELSDDFLTRLTDALAALKLSMKTYPEIIQTYKKLLSNYAFEELPEALADYIVEDLSQALATPSNYHSIMSDLIQVCGALYQKVNHSTKYVALMNNKFFPTLSCNLLKREHSSDLRQNLLETFSDLIVHIELTAENVSESARIFMQSLDYEVTVAFTMEILAKVCDQKPEIFDSVDLCQHSLSRLTAYLSSSDTSLYIPALGLLNAIYEKTSFAGSHNNIIRLRDVLFGLMESTADTNSIGICFTLLAHTLNHIPADEKFVSLLITSVINTKLADVDDFNLTPLEVLTTQIASNNTVGDSKLFDLAMKLLVEKNFISAKIMALICDRCKLTKKVEDIEAELSLCMQNQNSPSDIDRVVFDIHFLGCVSSVGDLQSFTFQHFLEIPNHHSNDHICLAAARSMGLSIVRNIDAHLPSLLACYQAASSSNDPQRSLYLVALKQLLKEASWDERVEILSDVWDSVIGVIVAKNEKLSHKGVSELKLAADVLSLITEIDACGDYQHKILAIVQSFDLNGAGEHIVYTVVAIMKQLVGRSADDIEVQIIERLMAYLAISNLELKSAIVSTLLTGIYNKSHAFAAILNSVILPSIYEELSAKEEFKKTIPMGPYKYVIDEGLEVRKLSYELISAILTLNSNKANVVPFSLDEVKVFEVLSDKGLRDQENEIINLTIFNLTQIIEKNDSVVSKSSNHQTLVASLTKLINRKLRSKASTQESESFEDTLRAVIGFSKVINTALIANNAVSNEWSTYYHELQNKHHLLFSAASA